MPRVAPRELPRVARWMTSALPRTPARVIGRSCVPGVWRRRHLDADLGLPMTLDRGFRGAAVLLAPDELELRSEVDVGIDDAERKTAAVVVAVPREHRETDDPI